MNLEYNIIFLFYALLPVLAELGTEKVCHLLNIFLGIEQQNLEP